MRCFAAAGEIAKAKTSGEEALLLFTRLSQAHPAMFDGYKQAVAAELAKLATR
jgi:hypothetical protein